MDLEKLFKNFPSNRGRIYFDVFNVLKPLMLQELRNLIIGNRKRQTGRPLTTDLGKILDAFFYLCETGSQIHYVWDIFGIPKSTFYRYFKLINDSKLFELFYQQIVTQKTLPTTLITDTFIVKSMRGSDGLGRNPVDRGRKGLKVSLICDTNYVTHAVHVAPANVHDSKLLIPTIRKLPNYQEHKKDIICLSDSGYVGKDLTIECQKHGLRLVAKPKKVGRNGKMSHTLTTSETQLLQKFRTRIELLNGNIRRFRGLMIKWVQSIGSYVSYLYLALICITTYRMYV